MTQNESKDSSSVNMSFLYDIHFFIWINIIIL